MNLFNLVNILFKRESLWELSTKLQSSILRSKESLTFIVRNNPGAKVVEIFMNLNI